jgi:hypothetical protein
MSSLKHVGIMGMKWGHRKAQAKAWLKEAGTTTKNSLLHPYLTDKANKASINSEKKLGTRLRRSTVYQKTKELKDVNSRVKKMQAEKAIAKKNKPPLQERIDKAYGIVRKNGKIKLISLDTIPKIAATAFVAKWALNYVAPKVAWQLGTVLSSTPIH